MPINSPRTMGLQAADAGGGGLDEANAAFEQGFSQIAYNVLTSRMPDLIPQVVTFKVLTADVEKGSAVGAFIVMHGADPIYVPVIMADNQIKPLEIFFNKRLNIFLPLTKAWLSEMEKTSLETLGTDTKPPDSLATDVDIRNIMVPPITGRYSYAAESASVEAALSEANLDKVAETNKLILLDFLKASPNAVKEAFVKVLEENPSVLKKAATFYGVAPLADALRVTQTKEAALQLRGGALWIADKDTNTAEFKRMFGDKAPEAYRGLLLKGYAAKDTRETKNLAMQVQPYKDFEVPTRSGVFRIQMVEGDEKPAMVFVNPTKISETNNTKYSKKPQVKGKMPKTDWTNDDRVQPPPAVREPYEYLVVMPDGSWTETASLCAQDSVADELSGDLYKKVFTDATATPRPGLGIFVRTRGMTIEATEPVKIKSVTVGTGGVRRVSIEARVFGNERVIVTDPRSPVGSIVMPKGTNTVFMPDDFVWLPLKARFDNQTMHQTPSAVMDHVMNAMGSAGVHKAVVKNAGAGQFSVDGTASMNKVAALRTLATKHVISIEDAEALLEKAASDGVARAYIVSPAQLTKLKQAAEGGDAPAKKSEKKPAADSGAQDEGGDAEMQAQMEAQMAQEQAAQAAAQPSAVDLAAAEMQHMLQLEQQKLVEKQQMLAQLTQRANEIASGAPVAPPIQSQMMGAPPPGQMAQQPMPQGQDPNAMAQMQGQDPNMMGQDPNAMAQMQGQDPNMMGQEQAQPMPMMSDSGLNASSIQQQISPQFLDMAGDLQSADVFDAAAVSSLANSAAIRELVGQYMPNLETALDNLGRVLLSLWMKEGELKGEVGGETFTKLEDNLRNTFKGLGDLVLKLNQNAQVLGADDIYENA